MNKELLSEVLKLQLRSWTEWDSGSRVGAFGDNTKREQLVYVRKLVLRKRLEKLVKVAV